MSLFKSWSLVKLVKKDYERIEGSDMSAKDIVKISSNSCGISLSQNVKNCLFVIVLVAAIGSFGLISTSYKTQQNPCSLKSHSSVFHFHFLNNLSNQNYIVNDEDDTTDSDNFNAESYKRLFNLLSVTTPGFLTSLNLNLTREALFDPIDSSPYTSFFALLPLRSPPLFS